MGEEVERQVTQKIDLEIGPEMTLKIDCAVDHITKNLDNLVTEAETGSERTIDSPVISDIVI